MPVFENGNKAAQRWSEETAIEKFNEIYEIALKNNGFAYVIIRTFEEFTEYVNKEIIKI